MMLYYSIDKKNKPFMAETAKEINGSDWDGRILTINDVLLVSHSPLIPWLKEKKSTINTSLKKGGSILFFPPFELDQDLGALLSTKRIFVKKSDIQHPTPFHFSKEMREYIGGHMLKGKASYYFQTVPSTGIKAMIDSYPIIVGFRRMNGEGYLVFCSISLLLPDMNLSIEDRKKLITAMIKKIRDSTGPIEEEEEKIFPQRLMPLKNLLLSLLYGVSETITLEEMKGLTEQRSLTTLDNNDYRQSLYQLEKEGFIALEERLIIPDHRVLSQSRGRMERMLQIMREEL